MRVASLGVARPAYYDRNATSAIQTYVATVSPHSQTTRWTTTVAAGTKLVVEAATVFVQRATAATTPLEVYGRVRITSGANVMVLAGNAFTSNTLAVLYVDKASAGTTIYAGETVTGVTSDGSTGGTAFFEIDFKGTVYDA